MLTKERVCGLRLHVEVGGGGRRKKRYCPYLRGESIHNKNNEKKLHYLNIRYYTALIRPNKSIFTTATSQQSQP